MKMDFTFKHLDHSESLENYTQTSIDKISHLLLKNQSGHALYSKNKSEFTVDILVSSKQRFFRSKAKHFDIYSAVDMAIEKLKTQILKIRKINQSHKKLFLSREGKLGLMNNRFEIKARYRKAA